VKVSFPNSGRVKTSGRGTKGQKARENVSLRFAGSSLQASWLKRLPLTRGKGKNKTKTGKSATLNLSELSKLKEGAVVSITSLKKMNFIGKEIRNVKVVDTGKLTVALKVKIPVSKKAAEKITKAGGEVILG
jgi:large subunit ribosomal protein L15